DLVRVGVRVEAEQPDRAGVRPPQPDSAFDGGGFTRPVRSQNSEDLTLGHRERDVVHRDQRPVRLAEMRDLDGRPVAGGRGGLHQGYGRWAFPCGHGCLPLRAANLGAPNSRHRVGSCIKKTDITMIDGWYLFVNRRWWR